MGHKLTTEDRQEGSGCRTDNLGQEEVSRAKNTQNRKEGTWVRDRVGKKTMKG